MSAETEAADSGSRALAGRWRKRAAAIVLASLVGWQLWNGLRAFAHPWGDLDAGQYTDHFSHMNAARAFTRVGVDLWRKGAGSLFPAATPEERGQMPADARLGAARTGSIHVVPGWPLSKPWVSSWTKAPRLYPPGDLLLVAPVAILYHFTELTLSQACRLLLALFILTAHVFLFVAIWHALGVGSRFTPVLWLCLALTWSEVLHWTLNGFYDATAAAPLLLCACLLAERRPLAALLAFSLAVFLHFRAWFLAPWAMAALGQIARQRAWRVFRPRDWLGVTLATLLAFLSLGTLALVAPALASQTLHNPLHLSVASWNTHAPLVIVVLATSLVFAFARAWLDLAVAIGLTLAMLLAREAYPWHALIPMAWLVAPVSTTGAARDETVRFARLTLLGWLSAEACANAFWPFWLQQLPHS